MRFQVLDTFEAIFPPLTAKESFVPSSPVKRFPHPQLYLSQIQTQNLHNIINKKYKLYQLC